MKKTRIKKIRSKKIREKTVKKKKKEIDKKKSEKKEKKREHKRSRERKKKTKTKKKPISSFPSPSATAGLPSSFIVIKPRSPLKKKNFTLIPSLLLVHTPSLFPKFTIVFGSTSPSVRDHQIEFTFLNASPRNNSIPASPSTFGELLRLQPALDPPPPHIPLTVSPLDSTSPQPSTFHCPFIFDQPLPTTSPSAP